MFDQIVGSFHIFKEKTVSAFTIVHRVAFYAVHWEPSSSTHMYYIGDSSWQTAALSSVAEQLWCQGILALVSGYLMIKHKVHSTNAERADSCVRNLSRKGLLPVCQVLEKKRPFETVNIPSLVTPHSACRKHRLVFPAAWRCIWKDSASALKCCRF